MTRKRARLLLLHVKAFGGFSQSLGEVQTLSSLRWDPLPAPLPSSSHSPHTPTTDLYLQLPKHRSTTCLRAKYPLLPVTLLYTSFPTPQHFLHSCQSTAPMLSTGMYPPLSSTHTHAHAHTSVHVHTERTHRDTRSPSARTSHCSVTLLL